MAGTFTHWMVVEDALAKLPPDAKAIKLDLLKKQRPYVLLGAVSPDLPYLKDPMLDSVLKTHGWANRMHYQNTGNFICHGMENLLSLKGEEFKICYAWLFGYASHVITDVVMHPVVNAIVGPYRFNVTEHRECEMTQDSLIFAWWHKFKKDIKRTKYHRILLDASDRPNKKSYINSRHIKDPVKRFWIETLKENYPAAGDKYDDIKPDDWFREYVNKINISANPSPAFRHFGEMADVVYLSAKELAEEKYAEQKRRYFDNVSIPGGGSDGFISVFRKAVAHVGRVWQRMASDIKRKDFSETSEYLKNWDLDQGLDMDTPDLWRNG